MTVNDLRQLYPDENLSIIYPHASHHLYIQNPDFLEVACIKRSINNELYVYVTIDTL